MARIILAEILKRKRISKRAFAKMLGITAYHNVFRLFHPARLRNVRFSTLEKWAKILKVKVRDLIKD